MNWDYSGQIHVIPFYTMKRQEENEEHNPKKKTKTIEDSLTEEPKQLTFYQPPSIPLPFPYSSVGVDNRPNAPPEQSCFTCQNSFKPTDRALFTQGRLIHDTCFYCDTCNISLQGVNHIFYGTKIYCEPDYNLAVKAAIISSLDTRMLASPTKTSIEPNILSLMSQPASYQIANYNLHPTPVVNFDVTLPTNGTVTAILVDGTNHTELPSGFQTGQTRQVEAGTKVVYFTGLKLAKMGKIKNDLEYAKVPQPDNYYIKFMLGNKSVNSTTFKIVSSTTMLPKDVKESVRPKKGGKEDKKS